MIPSCERINITSNQTETSNQDDALSYQCDIIAYVKWMAIYTGTELLPIH
ncbi:unnamed protein product, partial [Urochloa humidicola]